MEIPKYTQSFNDLGIPESLAPPSLSRTSKFVYNHQGWNLLFDPKCLKQIIASSSGCYWVHHTMLLPKS